MKKGLGQPLVVQAPVLLYFVDLLMCGCRERDSNPHGHFWPRDFKSLVSTNSTIAAALSRFGAANGTRTRDLNLGKVALYQLSYCRIVLAKVLQR